MTTLYFETEYIFQLINQRTIYLHKQIDPQLTQQMEDVVVFTEDEKDFFRVELRNAGIEVFKALSSLSRGITEPYAIDDYEVSEGNDVECVIYKIQLKDEDYTDIIVPVLQNKIQQALMHFIVLRWLKLKSLNNQPFFALEQQEFDEAIKDIRSYKTYGYKSEVPYNQL